VFFDARERNEVELSGTLRAALQIDERAKLEDAYVAALEQTKSAAFPPKEADVGTAESELNEAYSRIMRCSQLAEMEKVLAGAITREGIRKTQRLWLPYREAWIALGMRVRPGTRREVWQAWITRERTKMLAELTTGC
jgi:uncharacterized protein YecT (DUF1311 family)